MCFQPIKKLTFQSDGHFFASFLNKYKGKFGIGKIFFMHSIKSNFDKILCVLRQVLGDNSSILKKGMKPGPKTKFSDIEVIALVCTAEYMGHNSENYLFSLLNKDDFPGIISRRQFNDRRKRLKDQSEEARKLVISRIATEQKVFIVDSMPLRLCRMARRLTNKIGKQENDIRPNVGYCAAQEEHYFGYKLHAVCSFEGAVQFFDITPASFSDVNYLATVGEKLKNCRLIGDKGYISKYFKRVLKEESKVSLLTDSRSNAKAQNVTFIPIPYRGKRKRIETLFSQLADQFKIQQNYAKTQLGYFTRVESKLLAMTIMQYINQVKNKPISQIKYALL
jgi:hypothetical protein